jgi:hypothetical protein
MLDGMNIRQFREWYAYAELEPFGDERADYRSAQICAMIANANRDRKRKPTPYKVEEFLLKFGGRQTREKKDWRSMKLDMERIAAGYGVVRMKLSDL